MAIKIKYQRTVVDYQKSEGDLIRVINRVQSSNYVKRAFWLFQGTSKENQLPPFDTVIITAIDNAITKAIIISEVVRKRIADIYQVNMIQQIEIHEIQDFQLFKAQKNQHIYKLNQQRHQLNKLEKKQDFIY